MKVCVFKRRGSSLRKSRFIWNGEEMTGKNTINPVLRKVASILSEKTPYALKTLFQYKWGGSKTPTTYKMELLVILVTSEPEFNYCRKELHH